MKIDAPTRQDVRVIARNMRERDKAEFMAVSKVQTAEDLVKALTNRYGNAEDAIGVFDGQEPVGIAALIEHRPNVVTLGFFATDRFPVIAVPFTKFVKQRLFPQYVAAGVHRIECVSKADYKAAHRWLRVLGLEQEAVMPGYGKGRETYLQFAKVFDASSSSSAD